LKAALLCHIYIHPIVQIEFGFKNLIPVSFSVGHIEEAKISETLYL
jgi:hypothetical protein